MKIELLGDNCRKCHLLRDNIALALQGLGDSSTIEDIDDPARFAEYGLLSLPALAVNGRVRAEGQLLTVEEVAAILKMP